MMSNNIHVNLGEEKESEKGGVKMKKREGVVTIMGIFMIIIMLALLSYLYEMGRLTVAKIKAQNAADAAAAAGAIVYSNVRNNATVDYSLMKIYKEAAENAAKWQYALADLGILSAYYEKDWEPKDEVNINVVSRTPGAAVLRSILGVSKGKDLIAAYHKAFRIQDGMVTRFLAAYEDHIFKFWRIYEDTIGGIQEEHNNVRNFIDHFAKVVALYNLCYVPDRPMRDGLKLKYWQPACFELSGKHYPFVGWLGTGGWIVFDNPHNSNNQFISHDYSKDLLLNNLRSVFAKVQLRLRRTAFSQFVGLDWLGNRWAGVLTHQVYATAGASQKEYHNSSMSINFLDLLDVRAIGLSHSNLDLSSVRDKVIFIMNPDLTSFAFGGHMLPEVNNLGWNRSYIIPVVNSTSDNPRH